MFNFIAVYVFIGLGIYWYRNAVNPTNLLKETVIWPWYAYQFIYNLYTKKS